MANPPKRKKKRRPTVPANIAARPDREIMEIVLGKRVMRKVDQVLAEQEK